MKRIVLFNHNVAVNITEQVQESETAEARMTDATAPPVMETIWTVVLTDRATGEQIALPLAKKGRDGLIQDLQKETDLVVPPKRLFLPGS